MRSTVPVLQGYKAFSFAAQTTLTGPCVVNDTEGGCQVSLGDGGNGTLIVTNGDQFTCGDASLGESLDAYGWTGVGLPGNGAWADDCRTRWHRCTFSYHVWIGLGTGGIGTVIMNGGTATIVNANAQFGIGTSGGTGIGDTLR